MEDLLCYEVQQQKLESSNKEVPKELDKFIFMQVQNHKKELAIDLRVSHDWLMRTFRVKRKNIIRHIYLGLFCDLGMFFQNLHGYQYINFRCHVNSISITMWQSSI